MIRLTTKEYAKLTGKTKRDKKKPELVAPAFELTRTTATLTIPIVVASVANQREHWAKASGRKGSQRKAIQKALAEHAKYLLPVLEHYHQGKPISVTFTRLAPGELDVANLWSGIKAPEDAVAEWFGANDRPPLWLCFCRQEKSKAYGLRVEIERA